MHERPQRALDWVLELEAIKPSNGGRAEAARASSTDADATVTKMADRGLRPTFNARLASDCDTQPVVGVGVATSG